MSDLKDKDRENLEKLFLKSNEKDIFAKIKERDSVKFFLGYLLGEEEFVKNGILDVLTLSLEYNKPYVFNETWKKISHLKNKDFQLEICKQMITKALDLCNPECEMLKIVSNKVSFSLREIGIETLYDAFKKHKTDNLIFFFEKRRLKKQKDLINSADQIVEAAHFFNDAKLLTYLDKRKVNVFGSKFQYLKKSAINGDIEKLNYFRTIEKSSFKDLIDWDKEEDQPHEQSEKWLNSLLLKERLSNKLTKSNKNENEAVTKNKKI